MDNYPHVAIFFYQLATTFRHEVSVLSYASECNIQLLLPRASTNI